MWQKGKELELQVFLQKVQHPRGMREGDVSGQLARNIRGGSEQWEQDPKPKSYATAAESETGRESGQELRNGCIGAAVCHLRRSRRSHHPHCWSCCLFHVKIKILCNYHYKHSIS